MLYFFYCPLCADCETERARTHFHTLININGSHTEKSKSFHNFSLYLFSKPFMILFTFEKKIVKIRSIYTAVCECVYVRSKKQSRNGKTTLISTCECLNCYHYYNCLGYCCCCCRGHVKIATEMLKSFSLLILYKREELVVVGAALRINIISV